MNRPIPTSVHGVLDYLTAPTLFVLPRALGWNKKITNLLTGSALGLLGYSLMTRYELGLFKVLPMKGHLTLDMMSGAMLAAAPFMLVDKQDRNGTVIGVLAGLGAYEIAAGLLTQTEPQSSLADTAADSVSQLRELVTNRR